MMKYKMKFKINYYLTFHVKPFLRRVFRLCVDCNKPLWSTIFERVRARQLRLSVIKGMYMQKIISEKDAKELLNLPLDPDDPSTLVDDSALLDDPEALEKIEKDELSK